MSAGTRWWESAVCAQTDLDAFYGEEGGHTSWVVFAKRVCQRCPYKAPCLVEALEQERNERWRFGVRGGLGPDERRRLARDMDKEAA